MKFLTLELIKDHSRIDSDYEKKMLELYGNGAENNLFRLLDRTYDEILAMNGGKFPDDLVIAALMLVDILYNYRNPHANIHLSSVGYTFDFFVKPYIKL
ncbi:MAG: head-tail connector protein [Paludibacteraceae bacterium]|nr:head-tail connector protein [Paludibacteraceae bacterium]